MRLQFANQRQHALAVSFPIFSDRDHGQDRAVSALSNQAGQSQVTMSVCGSMISPRILIVLICLTALTGCAACLPGQSKLDKGMVANTASAQ